jgi:UDP-glucose:(heptosyl)LPS alpha-1,3-glucosyltransferase
MKLALIGRKFSSSGGVELYLQRLLAVLARRGHEVHLFAESWTEEPSAIRFHPVPAEGSRAVRPLLFAEAVKREVSQQAFDCVFSLERTIGQDVYRAGGGVHRVWLERRRQFAPWWKKPLTGGGAFHRTMLALEAQTFDPRNTGRIIVNSDMVRQEILQHFPFPPERIHLVRNGVVPAQFQNGQRDETRRKFGIKDGEFLLLFVGSGWERKGLNFVLRALPRLKAVPGGVKLLVVGKGKKPWGAPSNAIFAGTMSDLKHVYAAADLFVFPPIYEPSANVVIEALSAGLPVVTSVHNGAGEVIQENVTGNVVAEFWRPEILAQTIQKWIKQPRRVTMDMAALDLERNVNETLAILELAASEKKRLAR